MFSSFAFDVPVEAAVDRVVLEQVGEVVGRHEVVDADELDVRVLQRRAEERRPMRPKPLMPTLRGMGSAPLLDFAIVGRDFAAKSRAPQVKDADEVVKQSTGRSASRHRRARPAHSAQSCYRALQHPILSSIARRTAWVIIAVAVPRCAHPRVVEWDVRRQFSSEASGRSRALVVGTSSSRSQPLAAMQTLGYTCAEDRRPLRRRC